MVPETDSTAARSPATGGARGRFFVLDGVDGCGKSTQARLLAERLEAAGRRVLHLREPGSTPVGEELRELFLSRRHDLGPVVEMLLVAAARRTMLDERVAPALAAGSDVVCERFHPSTVAYQGVAGGLGAERVEAFLEAWASDPSPDLVVLLDLDVDEAAARRGAATDRMEDRGLEFQRRVAEGYRGFARREEAVLVDASRSPEEVAEAVWEEVERARAR